MMTLHLAKVARDMANDLPPVTRMKHNSDFSKSLPTPLFFRKIRGITGWARGQKGDASCMPWRMQLLRTTIRAGPCLIFPNGWEKSAEHHSATSITPETGAGLIQLPGELPMTSQWILDLMSFGNFGRKLHGNFASPFGIRTCRRRRRFLLEGDTGTYPQAGAKDRKGFSQVYTL